MATPSKFVRKQVHVFGRVHPKGIEYSWDKRNDGKEGWKYIVTLNVPINHDVKRHILPALYMALTELP